MNSMKTVLLLGLMSGLFLVLGQYLGGRDGMMIALVMAIVMNIGSYFFGHKIVLSMYKAQEVTEQEAPDLFHLVGDLAQNADLPMPRVYIVPDQSPNAFATGRNPKNAVVAVTEGILRLLTQEELAGVIAHELGHIKNRDILIQTIAATLAAAITYVAQSAMFARGSDDRGSRPNPIIMIIAVILAPMAAGLIKMAISRSREFKADRTGAAICGKPMWLAHALNKLRAGVDRTPMEGNNATAHMFIVNPFLGGGLTRLFSTHPPLEERIQRLQEMAGH